ncbi:hypothetical protein LCGC14_0702440 [marine sediment metagenome]|uniref:Uncharacterized protein n=1 Tax=marine sediment metagenome TaxID=412755 RepID=A0A0F9T3A3_9ZZZZ
MRTIAVEVPDICSEHCPLSWIWSSDRRAEAWTCFYRGGDTFNTDDSYKPTKPCRDAEVTHER